MTRVVVLNHYPVLPAANGGQHTVRAMASQLAVAWPTELMWTARKQSMSNEVVLDGRTIQRTVVPNRWLQRHAMRELEPLFGSIDADLGHLWFSGGNRALERQLLASVRDGDIVVLSHPWLWPAVRKLLQRRRALLVHDSHNVEHVLKEQTLKPGSAARHAVASTRRAELELVRRAELVMACTPLDAAQLSQASGIAVDAMLVGARGVALSAQARAAVSARRGRPFGRRAVFIGSRHPPNDDAACWLVSQLAPALPRWQFDIGGNCGLACRGLPLPGNVALLGHVDDLAALLDGSDVALNPITSGSGINMKVIDYMQHGLPVVSTPFGLRGFEGCAALVAERDDFAAALRALEAEPARALALGDEGVATVERRFSWDAVGERVRQRVAAEHERFLQRGLSAVSP